MEHIWIFATIAAAFFQNMRSALQKQIKGKLSNNGSAYVRFCYALPFVYLLFFVSNYIFAGETYYQHINAKFLIYCTLGGITQILFTVLLLWTFSYRSFAVATTLSKMEVIFIAMLSYPVLGDSISLLAAMAILVGFFGAILLSQQGQVIQVFSLAGLKQISTWSGLASGFFLGASSIFYRGALLELPQGNFYMRALLGLIVALTVQTVLMGLWIFLFENKQLKKIIYHWREAGLIGFIGMLTSLCWFCAFALQKSAYVRAVGQIELVFTFLATIFFFGEKVRRHEMIGVALIVAAIILIILRG